MNKTLFFSTLLLVTGCSTISEPPTSQLVLMATANKSNIVDTSKTPFNITCKNAASDQIDLKSKVNDLIAKAIEKETGLSPTQIKEAAELLYSGQFRSDIREIVFLATKIIPQLAHSLPQSGAAIHKNIEALKSTTQHENVHNCIRAILAKQTCPDQNALHNLFNDIYTDPSNEVVKETFVALLDNQSFRLALIVYANSNGVDIDNEDLDFVQNQLKKPEINIVALRDEGEKRLKQKYKIDEVKTKLDALASRCK